jgi:hypothetical protein
MIINKDKKVEYINKVIELVETSYSEIGTIYTAESIDTFNAIAVEKKYKRVLGILKTMKIVVENGEFEQFNETQVRLFFKNMNTFTLEVDPNLFQDLNLINYYAIPTFDFMNIINSIIYNEAVVRVDSFAEYINSDDGKAKLKADLEAQEAAKNQLNAQSIFGKMSNEEAQKLMQFLGATAGGHVTPNRYGNQNVQNPIVQPTVQAAEVVGQDLTPDTVKPVGNWK